MADYFGLTKDKQKKQECSCENCCPKLSYKQRMIGFIACGIIGWLIIFSSFSELRKIGTDPAPFVILISCGQIIAIAGTCFLSGPADQWKAMKHPARVITTVIFFCTMACTITFALLKFPIALTITMVIVQCCAYFWYTLSFIPFGQKMFKKCCAGLCEGI